MFDMEIFSPFKPERPKGMSVLGSRQVAVRGPVEQCVFRLLSTPSCHQIAIDLSSKHIRKQIKTSITQSFIQADPPMQTCGVNHSRDCDPVHHEECLKNERDDGV